jgi:hypothetical protein
MLASGIPYKFGTPWAASATTGYINTIPATAAGAAASQALGFPPATATPVGAGGTPPNIADINGVLNYATAWARWQQAGGPVGYDATFSAAIGGYPKGALISAAALGQFWLSNVDGNTTDPDTGGAGWQLLFAGLETTAHAASTYAPLSAFGNSGAGSGYQKLPSGIIIQWGAANITLSGTVTFPIAFPNLCLRTFGCEANASGSTWGVGQPTVHGAGSVTASNAIFYALQWNGSSWTGANPLGLSWLAIGY